MVVNMKHKDKTHGSKENKLRSRLEKVAHTRHHNKKEADKLLEGLEVERNNKQAISLLKRGRQLSSVADGKTDIATLDFAQLKQYVNKHDNIARIVNLEENCSNDVDALRLAVRTALQELGDRKMCSITARQLEEVYLIQLTMCTMLEKKSHAF